MRANSRGMKILLAGGLWVAPGLALAQTTSQSPASNAPAPSTAVGPSELQNFSLSGTETKPADQPAATAPTASRAPARSRPTEAVSEVSVRAPRSTPPDKS
ncbi:MAG TPA: hypothetical protein VM711_01380, partial [Sphingomicrobium sp.]|nr:hypothetical protein [Sphingomicrobium sp.]